MTDRELTIEEKKEILKEYKKKIEKIKSLEEQKMSNIETMVSAKAQSYDDMPKGNKKADISDCIVQLEELINKIETAKLECLTLKIKIESAIIKVEDGIESDVLRKKYIQFKPWETICCEIGYEWAQTHRVHSNALKHINLNMIHNDITRCGNMAI